MTPEAVYVLEKMAHGFDRMGRTSGRGFYDYDADDEEPGAPSLWSGLKVFERRRVSIDAADLRDRLLYVQLLESIRCLQSKLVSSPGEADAMAVRDCAFPASRGGPLSFADGIGLHEVLGRARALTKRYGERFAPPSLLVRLAEHGRTFGDSAERSSEAGPE